MADEFTKAALYWIKTFNRKVKEKIWMVKLIDLLNEYNEIHNYAPIEYYDDETNGFETNYVAFYKTCIIISKQFWFIWWLVENDKIDIEKLEEKAERKPRYTFINDDWRLWFKLFEVYETLLMLLSISDTPIDLLCSLLK